MHRVVWLTWCFSQKKEIEKLHAIKDSGGKIAISGDGRFDSPGNKIQLYLILLKNGISGFSAHYCTYSLQSQSNKKIVGTFVAAKHVVRFK